MSVLCLQIWLVIKDIPGLFQLSYLVITTDVIVEINNKGDYVMGCGGYRMAVMAFSRLV